LSTALLIADLEGIAAVTTLESLVFGGAGHLEACAAMTREVNAAIEGLVAQGFTHVRVSDTHRSGSGAPNLEALHPAAQPFFVDPDCYGGALLDGVSAIACVGMHAAGGTSGFAAHTVEAHCAWLLNGRPISEAELALWLAADRGIPGIFVAGDDVLAASLAGTLRTVVTKQSTGLDSAIPNADVEAAIRAAAQAGPVPIAVAPSGPLSLRFKTTPVDREVAGGSFTDRYQRALAAVLETESTLDGSSARALELLRKPFF